jgi:hypothetical protein
MTWIAMLCMRGTVRKRASLIALRSLTTAGLTVGERVAMPRSRRVRCRADTQARKSDFWGICHANSTDEALE